MNHFNPSRNQNYPLFFQNSPSASSFWPLNRGLILPFLLRPKRLHFKWATLAPKIVLYFTHRNGPIFGAKTDLLDLECIIGYNNNHIVYYRPLTVTKWPTNGVIIYRYVSRLLNINFYWPLCPTVFFFCVLYRKESTNKRYRNTVNNLISPEYRQPKWWKTAYLRARWYRNTAR